MATYRTEIRWGVIFTGVLLLWMLIEKWVGWHGENIADHAVMTNIFALLAVGVYVAALLDKRKNVYNGTMSWTEGFMSGFYITVVVAVLSPLAQWFIHTLISPEFFKNMIDHVVQSGEMSRSEATGYFNLKSYMVQGVLGALMMGVITSAVVAVFTKKKAV